MYLNALNILTKYWGHKSFRGSQEAIISSVLDNKDVLALMPTGGGKSICFQIPAMAEEGICIVVSPLVALIQDQVSALKEKGIKAIGLTGSISENQLIELLDNCVFGNYKFLYLSPERLQQEIVRNRILEMNVNLIAIDEAHCISQWGHDFRPSYLECSILRELKPKVPILALTATASKKVSEEIIENLTLQSVKIFKDSFARHNISYQVIHTENKYSILQHQLRDLKGSAIVYVRNRRASKTLSTHLNSIGISTVFYHGGMQQIEKKEQLDAWISGKTPVMVATNAFGMGIDKANVQVVIHYQLPNNIENYFQEAGRAGRDGKTASAIILTNEEDKYAGKKQFIDNLPTSKLVKEVYRKLNNHLQIAYGDGFGEIYQLNFGEFCTKYNFNRGSTFEVFKILDQNSIISLSHNLKVKTTLQFTATKEQLFNYFTKNPNTENIIKTTLRTYGGLFDFETKINLDLIVKKTGSTYKLVQKTFENLQAQGLAEFTSGNEDLEITFLVPREDDNTINSIAKKLKQLIQLKSDKFNAVLNYVSNTTICRSQQLLFYFDEVVVKECGICDICKSKSLTDISPKAFKKSILKLLKNEPLSSREIVTKTGFTRDRILQAIRELLEDELIRVDEKNQYVRK